MAHVAELDQTNLVIRVIAVDNAIADPEQWCIDRFGGDWKQTSYTGRIRGKFAGIGDRYDSLADVFVEPIHVVSGDTGGTLAAGGGTL